MEIDGFIWNDWSIFTDTFYHMNIEENGTYELYDGGRYEDDWKDNIMNGWILVFKLILI